VAQHLDPGFSILAVAADPTGALPLLSCIHPRELVTTQAVIPTATDMQTPALASQLTDMGTKPTSRRGRLLHKRRHVAVRSPEWVIAEIRCYPSPARSRARQPRQTREVASFDE
jgi:hypothetical protein